MPPTVYLELRTLAPRERHERIFQVFNVLKEGETVQIINDHDPGPLYYQFYHEYSGLFKRRYDKKGLDEWRVSITKAKPGEGEGINLGEPTFPPDAGNK